MTTARLGDHAKFLSGFAFKSKLFNGDGEGVPVIRIRDVVRGHSETFYSGEFDSKYLVQPGEFLVGMDGEFNLAKWRAEPALLNQRVCKIAELSDDLDRDYLSRCLRVVLKEIEDETPFVTVKHLSVKKLNEAQIPLPPLDEQKRIAAILDAADHLRAKRREAIQKLDELLQATFLDLFGECRRFPVSIGVPNGPEGTDFVLLSEIARLATGHTPDRKVAEYWDGRIPWISLTDIRDLDGTVSVETIQNVTEDGIANSSSVILPEGTVCFSRTASVGFVTVMGREMATSQDFVNWVCGDRLDPIYLMQALRISRPLLLSKSSGSTHKTIYVRHAEKFAVYLPPLELQQQFADIVSAVEEQKARYRAHLDELDTLFASLQSRAFKGEL